MYNNQISDIKDFARHIKRGTFGLYAATFTEKKMNKCLLLVLSLHSLGSPLEMGMKGKESHSQDVYSNHALKSIGDG